MKKFLFGSVAAILLSSGAAYADNSAYVSILGGPSFDPALRVGNHTNGMDTGFNGGARIGYGVDDWLPWSGFSVEADTFYNQSHYTGTDTRIGSSSLMGNLIYHFNTGAPFTIYGGAGAGAVHEDLDGNIHGSSTVFGWQALGGVEYAFAPGTSFFTEYRYQNAHDANIAVPVGNTSNNVSVGVKFSL